MRKVIAAINMTLDGFCDHTAVVPNEELHRHYQDLLNEGGVILYGRITYGLMEFWREILESPSAEASMNEFATAIDRIPKIVFSNTLKEVDWQTAQLAGKSIEATIAELKQEPGKDILIGSRSIMIQLMKQNLIDEYQLCIHPVVAGQGLPLFEHFHDRSVLNLTKTKMLTGGAVILYYEPIK